MNGEPAFGGYGSPENTRRKIASGAILAASMADEWRSFLEQTKRFVRLSDIKEGR
jgi:hypothetical protein